MASTSTLNVLLPGRDRAFTALVGVIAAVALLTAFSLVGGGMSGFLANMIGQLAAFAILALALDLIWGYLGILSLGHGIFFAIGGYGIAMHLLKHSYAVTGTVPDFMQFMGWQEFPAYWAGFEFFPYAVAVCLLLTAVVGFVTGYVSFRSRVGGVYFAIITQALVYAAMLLMFRNDTGFGGNNGMTGFAVIFGEPIGSHRAIAGMAIASLVCLIAALFICRLLVASRFGRLMIAARDDEPRLRSLGYDTLVLKVGVWCLSAILACIAGMLYVPQVGIVNPRILSPELSLEIAVWVAIGGRGRLVGAVIGALCVNALKFWLSFAAPAIWPFILSALVIVVVLAAPNGMIDIAGLVTGGKLKQRVLTGLSKGGKP
nr:urea ABC transporter permease subunit UrtC [Hartmannibacter diazotrophicus]